MFVELPILVDDANGRHFDLVDVNPIHVVSVRDISDPSERDAHLNALTELLLSTGERVYSDIPRVNIVKKLNNSI